MSARLINIIIVDDSQTVAGLINCMLSAYGEEFAIVGIANDAETGIRLCNELRPELVLMDIAMPGMSGIEATERIKRTVTDVKVVILTASTDEELVMAAMRAGVDGYCRKTETASQLRMAIRSACNNGFWLNCDLARNLFAGDPDRTKAKTIPANPMQKNRFSERERNVLQLVASGRGNIQIAAELGISAQTVKTYLRRAMDKLTVSDRTHAAIKAISQGIIELPAAE